MERCDASIFAGGGDVWSGERRTGGRYAGPAVSPRQFHRRSELDRGELGRLLRRRTRRLRHLQHEFHGRDEDRRGAPDGQPGDGAGHANLRMADHG